LACELAANADFGIAAGDGGIADDVDARLQLRLERQPDRSGHHPCRRATPATSAMRAGLLGRDDVGHLRLMPAEIRHQRAGRGVHRG